jgi:short-subunit dehydrogenase
MAIRFENSKVLLTGASGGIGEAIARRLHERGATLILSGRRADALEQLASELGDRTETVVADLARTEDVQMLCDRYADVDVLVANAGLPAAGTLDSFTPEQLDRAVDVNLRAPIQLARATVPGMVERGAGHVVLMSSLAGKVALSDSSIYCATKFGLRGFGFALKEDLRGTGVGVTTVFPGFVREAGMFHGSGVKLPRMVGTRSPEDVAKAVMRGIDNGRTEVDVAPVMLRSGGWLFGAMPSAVAAFNRSLGGAKLSSAIGEAQRDKR